MTDNITVSKGPLGEYIHLNIPKDECITNECNDDYDYEYEEQAYLNMLRPFVRIDGEPNQIMGEEDYSKLDWII